MDANVEAIRAYYRQSWPDYRYFWFDSASYALHFGYWDEDTKSHAESLANTNRLMAESARFSLWQDVLDAGCGVGGTAMWVAENHPVRVTGITISTEQWLRGRRAVAARNLADRVTIDCRNMTMTGFADASFDVAYAIESAGYAPSTRAFLAEMFRVLRPGGRLIVVDGFRSRRSLSEDDEHLLGSWLADWALPDLATIDEARTSAREVGFSEIEARDVSANMSRSFRRLHRLATLCGPFELLLWLLRLRSTVQHQNLLGARKQWLAFERGLWRYYRFSAEKPLAAS